jgi:beta-N-acetylhexosaminidase
VVIQDVIRGQIGFDGVLFTDDIAMQALAGNLDERAAKARAAGCDVVLWCGDDVEDMTTVCEAAGKLEGVSMDRWQRARQRMPAWSSFDARAGERELTELFGVGAA